MDLDIVSAERDCAEFILLIKISNPPGKTVECVHNMIKFFLGPNTRRLDRVETVVEIELFEMRIRNLFTQQIYAVTNRFKLFHEPFRDPIFILFSQHSEKYTTGLRLAIHTPR